METPSATSHATVTVDASLIISSEPPRTLTVEGNDLDNVFDVVSYEGWSSGSLNGDDGLDVFSFYIPTSCPATMSHFAVDGGIPITKPGDNLTFYGPGVGHGTVTITRTGSSSGTWSVNELLSPAAWRLPNR